MLLSGYQIEQGMMVVELAAPSHITLLSSYSRWNDLLDAAIQKKSIDRDAAYWDEMFLPPLLKHDFDDVQSALPYLEKSWVRSARRLVVSGRGGDEPL